MAGVFEKKNVFFSCSLGYVKKELEELRWESNPSGMGPVGLEPSLFPQGFEINLFFQTW